MCDAKPFRFAEIMYRIASQTQPSLPSRPVPGLTLSLFVKVSEGITHTIAIGRSGHNPQLEKHHD